MSVFGARAKLAGAGIINVAVTVVQNKKRVLAVNGNVKIVSGRRYRALLQNIVTNIGTDALNIRPRRGQAAGIVFGSRLRPQHRLKQRVTGFITHGTHIGDILAHG